MENNKPMKIKHSTLVLALLVLMFLADGVNSILLNMGRDFFQVSIFVRFFAQAYFLFLLLHTRRGLWVWGVICLFLGIWLVGALAASNNFALYAAGEYNFFESFKFVNKMLFFFVCWATFRQFFHTPNECQRLFQIFEWLILIQAVVIIVSFVFHIEIFAGYTYIQDGALARVRFGYRGLIPAENEISPFFIVAFFYLLLKVTRQGQGALLLILNTLAGLLTGTKVSLALAVVLLLYGAAWLMKRRVRKAQLSVLGVLFLLGVAAWSGRDYLLSRLAPTIDYFTYRATAWQLGPLSLLLTGRDLKVDSITSLFLPHFDLLNYLFGGSDLVKFATEMDIIDVFLKLGLVGTLAFYFLYIKTLLFSGGRVNLTRLLFVLVWLGVSATAGHMAFSAINGGYLAVLVLAFSSLGEQRQLQSPHVVAQEIVALAPHNPFLQTIGGANLQ